MKIFQKIKTHFKLKKDWQVVKILNCNWKDRDYTTGKICFTLLENGLHQRKYNSATNHPNDVKEHKAYVTIVYPWLRGAAIDGISSYEAEKRKHRVFVVNRDEDEGSTNNVLHVDFGKKS